MDDSTVTEAILADAAAVEAKLREIAGQFDIYALHAETEIEAADTIARLRNLLIKATSGGIDG